MILEPANKHELALALGAANRQGQQVKTVNLSRMTRVLWHAPEDLTVKVEAGITLAELQNVVGRRGQWLPVDPPSPERLTLAELLGSDLSGPRRFGFGTIREHLIGLQVVLADGRLASSGGNVVKNVAGYDLMKLFVGARDSLGFAVEATFKLLPRPEREMFVQTACLTLAAVDQLTSDVLDSDLAPVVLDWHDSSDDPHGGRGTRLVLGFAGTAEEVEWQAARAAELGIAESADLAYEEAFWKEHGAAACAFSVLSSQLAQTLQQLGPVPFVARAGNGRIHCVGPASSPPIAHGVDRLARRIKETFDPKHILPNTPA